MLLLRPCSTDAGSSQMVGSGDRLTVVGGGGGGAGMFGTRLDFTAFLSCSTQDCKVPCSAISEHSPPPTIRSRRRSEALNGLICCAKVSKQTARVKPPFPEL